MADIDMDEFNVDGPEPVMVHWRNVNDPWTAPRVVCYFCKAPVWHGCRDRFGYLLQFGMVHAGRLPTIGCSIHNLNSCLTNGPDGKDPEVDKRLEHNRQRYLSSHPKRTLQEALIELERHVGNLREDYGVDRYLLMKDCLGQNLATPSLIAIVTGYAALEKMD